MSVTVSEVRKFSSNTPEDLVPDEVITEQIKTARILVDLEKSDDCGTELRKEAIKVTAGFLTVLAWARHIERAMGTLPGWMGTLLSEYKELRDLFFEKIKMDESISTANIKAIVAMVPSAMEGWYREDGAIVHRKTDVRESE